MSCVRARFLHTEAFRLSAIYAAIFCVSVLAMGVVVLAIARDALEDQILQSSRTDIAAIARGYASDETDEAREVAQQLMGAPGASDFLLLQKNGKRIAGNLPRMAAQTGIVRLPAGGGHGDILGTGQWIAPGLYAFSGNGLEAMQGAISRILHTLSWLFAASLLLAGLGGLLVSRTFLHKSEAMAKACRAIMDGDMRARIPVRGTQDELDRLAATINEMLDRIAALMENLRQVTNDIAHDLRTPVSQLRQRLELARDGAAGDGQAALDAALARTDDILALFAALLRIAQIEGGARRAAFTTLELAPLLEQMREIFEAVAEGSGHRLHIAISPAPAIRGDRALLVQLLTNLTENAILHTPRGTSITLALGMEQDRATVQVSDDGPGVPAAEQAKLFRRLYRREASRTTPGYGLGLAMVEAIATLHGANVQASHAAEGGLAIVIGFPREA